MPIRSSDATEFEIEKLRATANYLIQIRFCFHFRSGFLLPQVANQIGSARVHLIIAIFDQKSGEQVNCITEGNRVKRDSSFFSSISAFLDSREHKIHLTRQHREREGCSARQFNSSFSLARQPPAGRQAFHSHYAECLAPTHRDGQIKCKVVKLSQSGRLEVTSSRMQGTGGDTKGERRRQQNIFLRPTAIAQMSLPFQMLAAFVRLRTVHF